MPSRAIILFCIDKMGVLSDAPQGFASAVSSLHSLPQGLLAELVSLNI